MTSVHMGSYSEQVDQALLHSVIEGNLEKVKYYVERGGDVNQLDADGRRNPLRLAVIRSNFDIVKYLVEEAGVDPSKDGRVLHMTTMAGDHLKDIFEYLVSKGADINGIDPTLGTPLMLSVRENGSFDTTKWLVSVKADVSVKTPIGTAVHNCCEHGTIELLDFLLRNGGDKLLKTGDSRDMTPLTVAASHARNDVILFLVKNWGVDVNFTTDVNPLFMAVQNNKPETLKLLIDLKANVNAVQETAKCYALHLAASNNFLDCVEILLGNNAHVDCEDPRGYTPLFMAGSEGYLTCVKLLIKAKTDVNHRAHSDNTTTIFHCANSNRVKVVKELLEASADPLNTRNDKNQTLAEIARENGKTAMANLLDSWVSAAPEERQKICAVCYKYLEGKMQRCKRCKARWFCSLDCQRADWPEHKKNCKAVQ